MRKLLFVLMIIPIVGFTQNVGIGTNNPTKAKFEVHGAIDATSAIFGGESSGVSIQRNWPGIGFNSYYKNSSHRYMADGFGALQVFDPGSGYMAFDLFDNGTKDESVVGRRAIVITNNGRMTVGAGHAAAATLEVARGVSPSGTAAFLGTKYNSHFNFGALESTHIRGGKDQSIVYINDVPFGRTALSQFVSINAPDEFGSPLLIKQFNGYALKIKDENSHWAWSTRLNPSTLHLELLFDNFFRGRFAWQDGDYSSVSDKRLKKNIQPLSQLLQKVIQLAPVEYEMADAKAAQTKRIGFLAQDVKDLFPELVTVSTDTTHGYKTIPDLHTLSYSGFGVIAIKAIQEQQVLIAAQGEKINKQEKSIENLREEIKEIKAFINRTVVTRN